MVRNPFPILITQFLFNADPPHLSSRGRTIGYQVHTSNGYFTKFSQQARPQRCGLTKHYPFTTSSLSPPLSLPLPKKTHLYCSTIIPFVSPPRTSTQLLCRQMRRSLEKPLHILFSLSSPYRILTKPNPPRAPHPPNHPTPPPKKNPIARAAPSPHPKKCPSHSHPRHDPHSPPPAPSSPTSSTSSHPSSTSSPRPKN